MSSSANSHGVVAAGHPETAGAGAEVLRAGGNAVDAAVAAVAASLSAEPGLTGLGGGGYMLVVTPDGDSTLLDFFVEAPGRGIDRAERAELVPIAVTFGDVTQIFNAGPASIGAYGVPAGLDEASRRFGSLPLRELLAPAVRLAREGVRLNAEQAYVVELLGQIVTSTPECALIYAPEGALLVEGGLVRQPDLADALERLGEEGSEPFYRGDIARSVEEWLAGRGAMLTVEDLASYGAIPRQPIRAVYRGRQVLTNPPPSAGGILIAYALSLLERETGDPGTSRLVEVMGETQAERTSGFLDGLSDPAFVQRFLGAHMGNTTHISVMDADGMACSVTCSNGEGSGVVVPGTGLHLNNMLGEEDLNPLGFHRHPPGRRLPSMMAPTVVVGDAGAELVLGSGGSNRIRSAILQVIVAVLDRGMGVDEAAAAPRLHFEEEVVYAEPGVDTAALEDEGRAIARFRDLNLFFGGVHSVRRDPETGRLSGGGDPRRGGSVVAA